MNRIRSTQAVLLVAAACALGMSLWTGCIKASLATTTGPVSRGQLWSMTDEQMVHVGETVDFEFVVVDRGGTILGPAGGIDYCVAEVGDTIVEALPDGTGRFHFSYTFKDEQPGETILVRATGYEQRRERDLVKIGDRWVLTESPQARADRAVAGDEVTLETYQRGIRFVVGPLTAEPDIDSGVLTISCGDTERARIYVDRPHRRGFTLHGVDPNGKLRVGYVPTGDQLCPRGVTSLKFNVHDVEGVAHETATLMETP